MAEAQAAASAGKKPNYSRRTLRALGRKKRNLKIKTDKEFAKAWFEGKSKRSKEKKVAYKKRHSKS